MHGRSKFTDEQIAAAIEDYRTSGDSLKVVAARHGMDPSYLSKLVKGEYRARATAPGLK
jgi:transposase-like protein